MVVVKCGESRLGGALLAGKGFGVEEIIGIPPYNLECLRDMRPGCKEGPASRQGRVETFDLICIMLADLMDLLALVAVPKRWNLGRRGGNTELSGSRPQTSCII